MKNITIFILILFVLNSCTFSFFKKSTDAKKIVNPKMSPAPGSYTTNQHITLSSESGGSIRYTIDGSTPTKDIGLIYSLPIELSSGTTTLKAIAYKDDYLDSDVISGVYNINVVADPVIIPNDKFLAPSTSVSISTTTQGATIRYTIDGSTPTQSWGNIFSNAFTISSNTTVKAIAYKSGYGDSQVVTANLKMVYGVCTDPVLTPNGGTYNPNQQVTMSCSTLGASMKYTTDGTDPSLTNGTIYTSPIVLTQTTTIKAIATADNYLDSQIVSANYTISNFPSSGLVAQWLFSGNADDTSGNNLNGTNYGCTLTKDRFGNDNSAYSFSEASFIEVAHDDKLNCYPITISFWINHSNDQYTGVNFINKIDNSNGFKCFMEWTSGGRYDIKGYIGQNSALNNLCNPGQHNNYGDGLWHNIVFIFDNKKTLLYIDNKFIIKSDWVTPTDFTINNTAKIIIGKGLSSENEIKIDDIRIYNRALTDSETQELYKEGGWNP